MRSNNHKTYNQWISTDQKFHTYNYFLFQTFAKNLDYLEASGYLDNEYFFDHYGTDDIDEIYNNMFSVIFF